MQATARTYHFSCQQRGFGLRSSTTQSLRNAAKSNRCMSMCREEKKKPPCIINGKARSCSTLPGQKYTAIKASMQAVVLGYASSLSRIFLKNWESEKVFCTKVIRRPRNGIWKLTQEVFGIKWEMGCLKMDNAGCHRLIPLQSLRHDGIPLGAAYIPS